MDEIKQIFCKFRNNHSLYIPLKVILIYLIAGCLWIFFSDKMLITFTKKMSIIMEVNILKGCLYVLATSVLGFYVIRKGIIRAQKAEIEALKRFEEVMTVHKQLESANKEIIATEEKIRYLAYYDRLTGLPNRSNLEVLLEESIGKARMDGYLVALLFIDLNNFGVINDLFSHSFGDRMLKRVGSILCRAFNDQGHVFRLEGDTFAIVLSFIKDENEPIRVAQQIIKIFEASWYFESQNIYTPVSIGISLYPHHGNNVNMLYANTNLALLHAKENKHDGYCLFHQDFNHIFVNKMELYSDLKRAITHSEFIVYYQPLIDTASRRIVGFEALVRWKHPSKGIVMPGNFIPVAEETGLIVSINEMVLKEACLQVEKWNEMGLGPLRIAVNFSAQHFQHPEFEKQITTALKESRLGPEYFEVEITETCAIKNLNYAIDILRSLKKTGLKVSLDDFGTGYSSLNYLTQLPIDIVKIDKSFLHNITEDSYKQSIAETVIGLAQRLAMDVVAEGVETEEQYEYLKKIKCNRAQGYLFSKPVPASDAEKLIKMGCICNTI